EADGGSGGDVARVAAASPRSDDRAGVVGRRRAAAAGQRRLLLSKDGAALRRHSLMAQPSIVVDRISKRYRLGGFEHGYRTLRDVLTGGEKREADENLGLRAVSLQVERGEALGLIGHNGAGKSTLLKILSRITEPSSGQAALYGRVASLLEVGTGFHPELTGRENIFLNGAILGMTRAEIR